MLGNHAHAASGGNGGLGCGCTELLCLLRLNEIALADPEAETGAKAMLDELSRLKGVICGVVAVPAAEAGRMRYIAHLGLPGQSAHSPLTRDTPPMFAQVMATRQLVQMLGSEGGPAHACVNVPLLGGDRLLGVLGLRMQRNVPVDAWTEQVVWAAADLIALLLMNDRGHGRTAADAAGALSLTRRQADVICELVEHGATNAQIAATLSLSARTVKIHLQAAYRQLGVRRRGDAIRLILTRHGDWLEQERERRRAGRRPI
jgi:DNA-binding CsgD family transcriptional regulator